MRPIAGCLVLLLLVPFVPAAAGQDAQAGGTPSGQVRSPASPSQKPNPDPSQSQALPDSPGSVPQQAQSNSQFTAQQPSPREQQAQQPVGTAVAGSVETTGVAASKPAGAAIAPAKQRRTRAFLIKVSAIVGAGVAIGTVAALANASPSRPPGAR